MVRRICERGRGKKQGEQSKSPARLTYGVAGSGLRVRELKLSYHDGHTWKDGSPITANLDAVP